jgi:hypothetical protein
MIYNIKCMKKMKIKSLLMMISYNFLSGMKKKTNKEEDTEMYWYVEGTKDKTSYISKLEQSILKWEKLRKEFYKNIDGYNEEINKENNKYIIDQNKIKFLQDMINVNENLISQCEINIIIAEKKKRMTFIII